MFKVTFPDSIPAGNIAKLLQALPPPGRDEDADMEGETFMLTNFDESMRNTKAAGG